MSTPRRRWVIAIAMLVGGFVLGVGLAGAILINPFVFAGGVAAEADQPTDSFTISGDLAEPFYPGGSVPLNLSITNPLDSELTISRLEVEVEAVDAPNATATLPCGVDDFAVDQMSNDDVLVVGAGQTRTLIDLGIASENWPQVRMLDSESNQDGCKGATFSLGYSATGRILG